VYRTIVQLTLVFLLSGRVLLSAQEFKLFDRTVQLHGFASQGFKSKTNALVLKTSLNF
jgi:hypothetical protein